MNQYHTKTTEHLSMENKQFLELSFPSSIATIFFMAFQIAARQNWPGLYSNVLAAKNKCFK